MLGVTGAMMAKLEEQGYRRIQETESIQSVTRDKEQFPKWAALSALLVCSGSLSVGLTIAYSSSTIPELQKTLLDSEQKVSWFGSVVTVGAAGGCLAAAVSVDRLGRKGTLILTAVLFVAGWLLISYAETFAVLMIGRFTTGVSFGTAITTAPIHIGEASPKSHRGMFGAFAQLFVITGMFVTYALDMCLPWRWLALVSAAWSVLWLLMLPFIPETPRYLIARGDVTNANGALTWLRDSSSTAEMELLEIQEHIQLNDDKLRLSHISSPQLYRPLIISVGLMVFQQLSGITAITFYMKSVFASANFLNDQPDLAPMIVTLTQIVAELRSVVLLERAGRGCCLLLIQAGVVQCVACVTLGLYFLLSQRYLVCSIGIIRETLQLF